MSSDTPSADASAGAMQYSVVFVNNSQNAGSVCIYQQDSDICVPDVMSLAWLVEYTFPTTKVGFSWSIEYDFIWSQTGMLAPGVVFMAGQTWPADLSTTNEITLTNNGEAYTFRNQRQGPSPGSLFITEDGTIPLKQAAVGIGMAGSGTFAVQAQPNRSLAFTPHPQYWIAFGDFIQGEVIDCTNMNNPAQIQFPANIYSMTATLNSDNTWTIQPTASMNAQYLRDKRRHPELVWGQKPAALPSNEQATAGEG